MTGYTLDEVDAALEAIATARRVAATASALQALPDGSTVDVYGRVFTARPTRVPWARMWSCRPGPSPDTIEASAGVLAAHMVGSVLDRGGSWSDVTVTLPPGAPADPSAS